ncbi:MAG: OmpA family protein [Alphaproteobacteria bacterium]|nr:OmpA family protein [Alphaproteobacteria bacterium]
MSTWKTMVVGCGLLGLAGCGFGDVETIRTLQPTGNSFDTALSREYQELALFEADEMYDWVSATRYAERGLAAAGGQAVMPFDLANFDLPDGMIPEMTKARADLMTMLDSAAPTKIPAAAADAQGKFDCWVEQQEENHQPKDIAACRDAFYAAMMIIKAEMTPKPAPKPEPKPVSLLPKLFTILFGFDQDTLTPEGLEEVGKAIASAEDHETPVMIVGHTDTAGPAAYNLSLSDRRARTVAKAMEDAGVPDVRVMVQGVGEDDLAVPTADGVPNHANRRVTITIQD